MDATSIRSRADWQGWARRIAWGAVWTWALCFGLIAYLGLNGGGYDPLVHDQVGIAVWWVLLLAVLVGALPRERLGALAWVALGALVLFLVWTALSLTWTESVERTSADVARVATYAGVFALALFSRGRGETRHLIGAVAAGIVFIALVALLSRLHPAWFPDAGQTGDFLSSGRERLSYPLNYWNALAALIAIGLPLVLQIATGARSAVSRAAAAAAIPALALTIFLTLSRSGIAAAFLALAVFLSFTSNRIPKLVTLAAAGAGGVVLVVFAAHRDALRHGLEGPVAQHQANEMLAATVLVCFLVGLAQVGISYGLSAERRPRWLAVSRRQSAAALVAGALIVLVVAVVAGAPGRATDAWGEFKRSNAPGQGAERLGSAAGENRYQFWSAAVRENASKPLTGTGSGTFEYWWLRDGDTGNTVQDAHSLYLQTLGELGIVGLVVLAALLLAIVVGGGRETVRAGESRRALLAAALAGCVAFCFTAAFDWMWQVPVLPVTLLLLGSALVTAKEKGGEERQLKLPLRIVGAGFAAAAIYAIAVPLASTSLVRESQDDFRAGDLPAALSAARGAQNAHGAAATPWLQEAFVLEAQGELAGAMAAARAATEREATNWRTWLVLSRIEAERGEAAAAVGAYRRARSLNPHAPIFER